MGNQLSGTVPQQIHPLEYYLNDLNYDMGEITFDYNMGSTRFFKVARIKLSFTLTQLTSILNRCKDDTVDLSSNEKKVVTRKIPGLGVAKVFVIIDPSLPLSSHKEKIKRLREKLKDNPSCLTYSDVIINDKVAILLRQYIKYNLYDRLSTRPFLNLFEKKWVTFQILKCIDSIHKANETHGDIKIENFLLTSSGWVLLTDFATYKPSYLPEDNPGEFSYFFDTSRRRTCNLAPERFVSESFFNEQLNTFSSSNLNQNLNNFNLMNQNIVNFVKPEMDLFSVGCVIGELFIEDSLFDLSTLLSYRAKGSLWQKKKELEKEDVELINENSPQNSKFINDVANEFLEFSLNENNRLKKVNNIEIKEIRDMIFNLIDLNPNTRKDCANHLKDLFECNVIPKYFFYLYNYLSNLNPLSPDEKIIKLNKDFEFLSKQITEEDCNGFLIIINTVLSCCRALIHAFARITGLNLIIKVISKIKSDVLKSNIILERILPYIMDIILKDNCPKVKSHSITCLTKLLDSVEIVPVSDKNVFPDYILPVLCKTVQDEYALVRTTLARNLPTLSKISLKFLNKSKSTINFLSEKNDEKDEFDEKNKIMNTANDLKSINIYNNELEALQKAFQSMSYGILTDKEINVRVELMLNENLVQLCTFFGIQKTNEVIFSHLITFLNERIDYELRLAFYQCIIPIASYLGIQSSPLIKPLLQQGFSDSEETVVNQSLITSSYLCQTQLINKKIALELVEDSIPLIVHPNLSIRQSVVKLIVSCSQLLSLAELNCRLLPMVKHFLKEENKKNLLFLSNTVSDTTLLLDSLLKPIPRVIYDLIFTKITSSFNLELFFEALEKYNFSNELKSNLNVSISDKHNLLSLSPINYAKTNSFSNLINCSTPSSLSASSNYTNQHSSAALTQFLDLLVEEGLNEENKKKLISFSNLIIKTFKQIKSTKSFINNNQALKAHSTLPKASSPNFQINRVIKNNFDKSDEFKNINNYKRLYSLNLYNQKYVPSHDNEWHIPSISSIDLNNIESFSNFYQESSNDLELAKEAEENMSEEGQDLVNTKENLKECKNDLEEQIKKNDTPSFDNCFEPIVTCPPCVYELNCLLKHKQRKFAEYIYNKFDFDKNETTYSLNDQSSSISSSATTIISSDGLQNDQNLPKNLKNLKQDGHYSLTNYRPKGKLIANLTEHTKSVIKVLAIENNLFFSCSLDGSIKLWDGGRINQSSCLINTSKHTYNLNKNDEWFQGMTYSFGKDLLITYTNKNDLLVLKVDNQNFKLDLQQNLNEFCKTSLSFNGECWGGDVFLKGYKENSLLEKKNQNNVKNYHITDMTTINPFIFVCSFSNSSVKAFDLRLPLSKSIWTMKTYPSEGLITCLTEGDSSLFIGTSYGHIAVFDTRFQLRSNTMSYTVQRRVRKLLYTPKGLFAAVQGFNEISVWDCETSSRTKTLWASNAPPLSNKISTNSVYSLISANYSNNDFNALISCGSDALIRYWDLENPHKSYIFVDNYFKNHSNSSSNNSINNTILPNSNKNNHVSYMTKFIEGMQLIQEYDHQNSKISSQQNATSLMHKDLISNSSYNSYNNWDPQDISPSHKNIINDIVWLNKSNVLVSASKDGCVKLWK